MIELQQRSLSSISKVDGERRHPKEEVDDQRSFVDDNKLAVVHVKNSLTSRNYSVYLYSFKS